MNTLGAVAMALAFCFVSACTTVAPTEEKETARKIPAYVLIPPGLCLEVDLHVYEREMRFAPHDI